MAFALVVSHSCLLAQEPAASPAAQASASASTDALLKKVGATCTVLFRNDVYASVASSNYRMTGKLMSVSDEWIVLAGESSEQWIPRGVVFYLDFPKP